MQVFLVGGAVRDALLGLPIKDKDFVVVGATPEQLLSAGFTQVGADFPVFLHPVTHHEYALARLERKSGSKHTDFTVQFSPSVTLADDLSRRDLTINALAIEVVGLFDDTPITQEVVDYHGGLDDLRHKRLRHVSQAFCEDPLRILRAVRFLARFKHLGFRLHQDTLALMQQMAQAGELSHLSRERLWAESVKAMEADTGDIYWQSLKTLNILPHFLKELDDCWQDELIFKKVIERLTLAKKCNMAVQFAILCSGYLENNELNKALIKQIAHQLNASKHPVHIANLLTDFYDIFNQTPKAVDIINLIEKTKAHQGNRQILDDTLTAIFLMKQDTGDGYSHAVKLLDAAITIYKNISIKDIDENLTGKEIGLALHQLRIKQIQQRLNETPIHDQ
ncbi:tRNA nucleotidyltransferase [Moraxella sp.]|uniref:tRNA nucleotidyltransferase n=1 Tax=Moraxella sp. TaxID=479 RepID=UPI0026DAEB4E|nr:tRNA nucleotidyltransferase [Moraxella sp.]MDO4894056.1 tRNA nucleotidyltransferase [Moraxella sp.]